MVQKALRDAFFSSPLLPRLVRGDVVKRTVASGVSQGTIGYAHKDHAGRMVLDRFNEALSELEVEIADDVFILKADDARRLLEPPRVAQLALRPDRISLQPGARATFALGALDQYGHQIGLSGVEWSSTTGLVSENGILEAGAQTGRFVVRARAGELEATAEVMVAVDESPKRDGGEMTVSRRTVAWAGTLAPQKWTSFYMKVLSKIAALPGVQIRVEFRVSVDAANSQHLSDELRGGLRDVGLADDIHLHDGGGVNYG